MKFSDNQHVILSYEALEKKNHAGSKPDKKCPKCKVGVLKDRAKRSFWVKYPLFFLPIKRYKCNLCDKKTYVFGTYTRKKVAF